MNAWYTIQTSDHHGAGARIPTAAATASWRIVYDGPIATDGEARTVVDRLAGGWARHARAFKGKSLGRPFYAVLDMKGATA